MYRISAIPLPHSRPHSHPAAHHHPSRLPCPTLRCAPLISRCASPSCPLPCPSALLAILFIQLTVPIIQLRISLILFPRFIFTNSGHDIIIANTDIHISRPDFPTKLLSTSPETREKTKKVAITCEKGTFQLPFRTLSPLFRPISVVVKHIVHIQFHRHLVAVSSLRHAKRGYHSGYNRLVGFGLCTESVAAVHDSQIFVLVQSV